ncbi:hypothetical protein [Pseudogracilibacillus sp. SO30301A]|uniref:hypothetical protein n=1 Tax=Pseudogracilibacillus sp. SO30301A TaxID=3098291 RepID=UPI00300DDD12
MGDDVYAPHEIKFDLSSTATLEDITHKIKEMSYLPTIYGGKATWVLLKDSTPLAVIAQQWEQAKFFDNQNLTIQRLFLKEKEGNLFFDYYAQQDPIEVFATLKN